MYTRIKLIILLLPTLAVGIWEWVRHQWLLPYISMDMGNLLTPLLVLAVSLALLAPLFKKLEGIQRELEQARAVRAAMEAREELARELHDGIAQSLFLLSVKMDILEQERIAGGVTEESIRRATRTVHEVNRYVRGAIFSLRRPASGEGTLPLKQTVGEELALLADDAGIRSSLEWSLPEEELSAADRAELAACIREALMNVRKHAHADAVTVTASGDGGHWTVEIRDNGKGFSRDPFGAGGSYGLKIMKERAESRGFRLRLDRRDGFTTVEIAKGAVEA